MSRATSNDTTVPMVVMSKPLAATSVAISKFLPRASRGYKRCLWHQRNVKVWNGVKWGGHRIIQAVPSLLAIRLYEYTTFIQISKKGQHPLWEQCVLPPGGQQLMVSRMSSTKWDDPDLHDDNRFLNPLNPFPLYVLDLILLWVPYWALNIKSNPSYRLNPSIF